MPDIRGPQPLPYVFVGSSSEGKDVARHLKTELEASRLCEVALWDSVFRPSNYALESLLHEAERVDFAVLIATPDDMTLKRETQNPTARDNVIFEFGIFAGQLGRDRTYLLLTDSKIDLPSDLHGLTWLPFMPRQDGSLAGSLTNASLKIEQQITALGPRRSSRSSGSATKVSEDEKLLGREISTLCVNAVKQGWRIQRNDETTLRLRSPRAKKQDHVLVKRRPATTRRDLRAFVNELRAAGLRVNGALRVSVDESPFEPEGMSSGEGPSRP